MKRHVYNVGEYVNKHLREQNAAQRLSAKRNWSTGVMIGGMMGSLKYLKRIWPKINIERAMWALEMVELDIDQQWYEARDAAKANLDLHALQHGGSNAQDRDGAGRGAS